ncbi:MAG: methyltransferase domain-containing protein [Candidatus Aegiribacteria sp.]|nr:methyltransferase domain-containing protein [Candidatus Aegiribacteria sp.]MBD3294116.1 methyltransferase domain-containing protein [Candidatus Fermentibacteria bacterium]
MMIMKKNDKRDWSEKDLKKHLVEVRKYLWRDSTIRRIAEWLDISGRIKVLDAGCGLGYLGLTFWDHFGKNSLYTGLDCSRNLLKEAASLSSQWAVDGSAAFIEAGAYNIPASNDSYDLAMCQTLLMHLQHPLEVLEEMVRVTKPGGVIMCMEPDNISATMSEPYSSIPPLSDRDMLWLFKMRLIWARGREKLGRGDWGIGKKLPRMMYSLGLERVDALYNDAPRFLNPPYETEEQKYQIRMMKKNNSEEEDPAESRKAWKRCRECFIAGGASLSTFYRYKRFMEKRMNELRDVVKQQLEKGEFFGGIPSSSFYCVRGYKPY